MKRETYSFPVSSFLSNEKDTSLIIDLMLKNNRLKKMLYYTSKDCLDRPNLTEDQALELCSNNIKLVPKLYVDGSVLNYVIISYDNFVQSENPEYRDCILEFDIICHFDQWQLKDFALRPYKIAAEIDTMLNHKDLTGIGHIEFLGANQIVLTDEFAGLCLMYQTYHGVEDKKDALTNKENSSIINNFNEMFNNS